MLLITLFNYRAIYNKLIINMKERDIEEVTNTFENMHESIDKINCAYDKLNTTIKHKHNIKSYILQNKCNIFYFILFIILLYIINFIILK